MGEEIRGDEADEWEPDDAGGFVTEELYTGAVFAGRYRVERILGQGGMGLVVQATHLQLHQPVAMKFLLPEMLGNQQVVQRFLREAQAAVRLKSEHVARVIDVGSLESGAPYMVLEYLEGSDLSSFQHGQLSIGAIVDLVLQACEAMAEAHSIGIVHRDIKPANFFITRGADGAPLLKLLDFGISKAPMGNSNLTATQAVMGTPAYMSPEQMHSSRDVDHRSDIWSLGIVLYELLNGAPPFSGDTFSSLVIKVATAPLPRLTVQLPGDLDAIIYRCLEKDPARRFQNVAELAQAIARYAQSETQAAISVQRTRTIVGAGSPSTVPTPGLSQRAVPSTISEAAGVRTAASTGGRRWSLVAVIGLLAGFVVVAITAVNGGSSRSEKGESQLPGAPPQIKIKAAAPSPPPNQERPSPSPSGTSAQNAGGPPTPSPSVVPADVSATPVTTPPVVPPGPTTAAPAATRSAEPTPSAKSGAAGSASTGADTPAPPNAAAKRPRKASQTTAKPTIPDTSSANAQTPDLDSRH